MKPADIARVVRALREAGCGEIVVSPDGTITGRVSPVAAVDPQQAPPVFVPTPFTPTAEPPPWLTQPKPWTVTWSDGATNDTCLLKGFMPGEVVGIACPCPRCSPQCAVSTAVSASDDVQRVTASRTSGEVRVRVIPLPNRSGSVVTS